MQTLKHIGYIDALNGLYNKTKSTVKECINSPKFDKIIEYVHKGKIPEIKNAFINIGSAPSNNESSMLSEILTNEIRNYINNEKLDMKYTVYQQPISDDFYITKDGIITSGLFANISALTNSNANVAIQIKFNTKNDKIEIHCYNQVIEPFAEKFMEKFKTLYSNEQYNTYSLHNLFLIPNSYTVLDCDKESLQHYFLNKSHIPCVMLYLPYPKNKDEHEIKELTKAIIDSYEEAIKYYNTNIDRYHKKKK